MPARKSRISRIRPQSTGPLDGEAVQDERQRMRLRHSEVGALTVLWGLVVPLLPFIVPFPFLTAASIVVLAGFSALLFHALSLSPFCVDKVTEDDEDLPPDEVVAARDQFEEVKVIYAAVVIVSAVGCIIAMALGGDVAFQSWKGSGTRQCEMAQLGRLQEFGHAKFFCQDGYVDAHNEANIVTKNTGFRGAMRVYRVAPIYSSKGSKLPVAWSVARDSEVADTPCEAGLCGLFVADAGDPCKSSAVCFTSEERKRLAKLQDVVTNATVTKALHDEGNPDFDARSLPMLVLTDPDNPLGNLKNLRVATGFWAFTFLGALAFAADVLVNEVWLQRGSSGRYTTQYSKLEEDGKVEDQRSSENSSEGPMQSSKSTRFAEH